MGFGPTDCLLAHAPRVDLPCPLHVVRSGEEGEGLEGQGVRPHNEDDERVDMQIAGCGQEAVAVACSFDLGVDVCVC